MIYGGRTGEHEISLRSAKSIIEAMDTEKYKVLHYVISKEGKWSPRPILPEPGGNPGIDVVFPGVARHLRRRWNGAGLAGTGRSALRGRGRTGVVDFDGQGDDEARGAKSAGCRWWNIVSSRRGAVWAIRSSKFDFPMFVKPANLGSSVGISKAHDLRRTDGGRRTGAVVRSQGDRRARHHRPRVRMRGARQ